MFKKNEIAKVRMGLHNRPCRVRIVDVVGDDAMVQLNNGTVRIVDVRELLPILEGRTEISQRRRKSERRA
jgi:sRNA-binding protein